MSDYITPHEAALAVVATSMKKSRLRFDTLVLNSIMGGILFTAGGMLHVAAQADPTMLKNDPGVVHLIQGLVYPIGLFYVVIMGSELFNSNVLFFTVGLLRGAVGILDLLINWFVSWLFNLGANLFVCYVICYLGGTFREEPIRQASIDIMVEKAKFSFIETFIKGIACNFFVSIAIYLQIMCKPLHVKFLMMILPVFTFVTMGYSHTVADMFLCPMGLMNGADVKVKVYIWKVLIPETLGNIVGGAFFAIAIPYYSHLIVVERDSKEVGLPKYDARDEQPELMMDSRVVRNNQPDVDQELERILTKIESQVDEHRSSTLREKPKPADNNSDNVSRNSDYDVREYETSPPGLFPVKGMGAPLQREQTIASGISQAADDQSVISKVTRKSLLSRDEYLGNRIIKTFTRRPSGGGDEESQTGHRPSISSRNESIRPRISHNHLSNLRSNNRQAELEFVKDLNKQGITANEFESANDVVGDVSLKDLKKWSKQVEKGETSADS